MRPIRLAATFLAAVAVPIALALPAAATVNPTVIFNSQAAGAFAALNANRQANGDRVTGVRAEFFLLPSAQFNTNNSGLWHPSIDAGGSTAKGGALLGVQLCRPVGLTGPPGEAAVLFVQWNSTSGTFDVFAGHSSSVDCLGALGGVASVTQIDRIPAGHQVFLAITQGASGTVFFTDSDLTNDTGGFTTFGGFTFFGFNRGGIGTNSGIDRL